MENKTNEKTWRVHKAGSLYGLLEALEDKAGAEVIVFDGDVCDCYHPNETSLLFKIYRAIVTTPATAIATHGCDMYEKITGAGKIYFSPSDLPEDAVFRINPGQLLEPALRRLISHLEDRLKGAKEINSITGLEGLMEGFKQREELINEVKAQIERYKQILK